MSPDVHRSGESFNVAFLLVAADAAELRHHSRGRIEHRG